MDEDYGRELILLGGNAQSVLEKWARMLTILGSAIVGLGGIFFALAYFWPRRPPKTRMFGVVTETEEEEEEVSTSA